MRHATTLRPDEVHHHGHSPTTPQPADRSDVMQMEAATLGNAAFSGIVARRPGRFRTSVPPGVTDVVARAKESPSQIGGAVDSAEGAVVAERSSADVLARAPRGKSPYPERKKGKEDDGGEKDEEKEDAGLLGVLSKVNTAIGAISTLHEAWDKVFKAEVTKEHTPIPPMMTEEAQVDLDRALRHETSRLLCEYVFKKAQFYDIDIKKLVQEKKAKKAAAKDAGAVDSGGNKPGAKTPAGKSPGAKSPAPVKPAARAEDEPNFAALEKDLEGLNELAIGDLKQQAIKIIAKKKHAMDLRPDHFWWNHEDDWGISPSQPRKFREGGFWEQPIVVLEYGVVTVRPIIGHLDGPVMAGLHEDVEYFNIPRIGVEQVNPRWWIGGTIEGTTSGTRNMNSVKIDHVTPVADQDKPMSVYKVHATFDWDESNTFVRFNLQAGKISALIMGIEREHTPDIGWI